MGIAKNYVSRYIVIHNQRIAIRIMIFITLMLEYFFIHFIEFNKITMLIE